MAALRGLVSKKKVRFQEDDFDLDLTYITEKIIGEFKERGDAENAKTSSLSLRVVRRLDNLRLPDTLF